MCFKDLYNFFSEFIQIFSILLEIKKILCLPKLKETEMINLLILQIYIEPHPPLHTVLDPKIYSHKRHDP